MNSFYKLVSTVAGGTQAITGVGFTPTLVIAWSSNGAGDVHSTVDYMFAMGVGIETGESGTKNFTYGASCNNNRDYPLYRPINKSTVGGRGVNYFLKVVAQSGGTDFSIGLVSFDSDGITITNPGFTGRRIHMLFLDPANVFGYERVIGSTGSSSITAPGFQTTAILFLGSSYNTLGDPGGADTDDAVLTCGVAAGAGQFVMTGWSDANVATPDTQRYFVSGKAFAAIHGTSGALDCEGSVTSFDSTGFTYNTSTFLGTTRFGYLAIGGDAYEAGVETAKTSTGTKTTTLSDTDLTPKFALLGGVNAAASSSIQDHNRMALGGGLIGSEGSVWVGDEDGASPSDADRIQDNTKAIQFCDNDARTVNDAADLSSFGVGTLVLDWTTASGTARQFGYFVGGDAAAAGFAWGQVI